MEQQNFFQETKKLISKFQNSGNFESLMGSFLYEMKEGFNLLKFSVFDLSFAEGQKNFSLKESKFAKGTFAYSDELNSKAEIQNELKKLDLLNNNFSSGIHSINLLDQDLWFFQFSRGPSSKLLLLCDFGEINDHLSKIDLLIHLVQNESEWWEKLKLSEDKLNHDDLTGSYNQRYLDIVLDAEIKRASRFESEFGLLFLDLDNFKSVNDIYGHMSGSSILKQVSKVFSSLLREVDSVIRYGGDEFVIVLLGADCESAMHVAERIRFTINNTPFRAENGELIKLSVSIGIASYPQHGHDKKTLLTSADSTMYESKRSGKNKVSVGGKDVKKRLNL